MLSILWSKKRDSFMGSGVEGLRILTKLANGNSNVVLKPILLQNHIVKSKSSFASNDDDDNHSYCYLKSCHLCHKPLSLDKEIYMYRGDLGFCSVECRDRQIYLDETKKIENSTQKILASFRQRRRDGGGRCETSRLLEESRERRHPFSCQKSGVVFSYS
ncbi:hypothetical protein CDL12_06044 [Handroanthus impetiginosus]|uniref:FLZ-type domain-containing protein n=1 Tax=Handroanthus impetiginosus TaxID=429701 RepID=A0A2G9HUS5_9LAMI|nr:hypothetical protein CDL12_06044 [Handroanthus impetiginosus]